MLQKQYLHYVGNKPVIANEDLDLKAGLAWDPLNVGVVVIVNIPSWRVDQMPYGGVQNSVPGREGESAMPWKI